MCATDHSHVSGCTPARCRCALRSAEQIVAICSAVTHSMLLLHAASGRVRVIEVSVCAACSCADSIAHVSLSCSASLPLFHFRAAAASFVMGGVCSGASADTVVSPHSEHISDHRLRIDRSALTRSSLCACAEAAHRWSTRHSAGSGERQSEQRHCGRSDRISQGD